MQVPPKISYRDVEKTDVIDDLITTKIGKLQQVNKSVMSVRVAIEQTQKPRRTANPYRVRIDVTVPPNREIVVIRHSMARDRLLAGERNEPLQAVIRRAFKAMTRQLEDVSQILRGDVKTHPEQSVMALVSKIFPEEGYGFLRTTDNRNVYFHRNSVLHGEFERLAIGTGVRYAEEVGEKGLQASSVEIVDKPGVRASSQEE